MQDKLLKRLLFQDEKFLQMNILHFMLFDVYVEEEDQIFSCKWTLKNLKIFSFTNLFHNFDFVFNPNSNNNKIFNQKHYFSQDKLK